MDNDEKEHAVWDALREHLSPMDEHYELICAWVRDGIADGSLVPTGIPSLLEKFRRVMATHQQIAEREGTMPATADGEPSIYDNIKPMKARL